MKPRAAIVGMILLGASISAATSAGNAQGDWRRLFDGHGLQGWRNVGKQTVDPRWQVIDGVLTLTAAGGGDLISRASFTDFELELEWQLEAGGNSGLFYRAQDVEPIWARAAEYQLLDDARAEDRFNPTHRAGAVYDLVAPDQARLNSAGEYNVSRVLACGTRVAHWLNGRRVAMYDTASADWRRRLAVSKFAATPDFAAVLRGHIGLQDHGNVLRVRSLRIRELRPDCVVAD